MPCSDPKHINEAGENIHYWPPQGALRVWPCERECGFCGFRARDSSQLRSHVREVHVGQDYPDVTVLVGQRRPPMFDSAIHGTAHLRAQYEGNSSLQQEQAQAGQTKSNAEQNDDSTEDGQDETDAHQPEPVQSNEASAGADAKSNGPSAPVKTRSRNIQVTEKAAAAAADGLNRKRKRAAPIKSHPHESFPSRKSPRGTTASYSETSDINGAGQASYTKETTVTSGQAVNGHNNSTEKLYANITDNIAGLLEFADACGLDKIRVYDAANDALKKWLLSRSSSKD
ncbi:hypothetical protein IWX49DRAFT_117888 [Phyllosticta citricarpa]|uniref:C2H2-type domain-containing protein n=2 Tax=Phyllosticta TaxID=121621 RepID=A0ABR1MEZ1_9PEZI